MRYFKTTYGTIFDTELSRLLTEQNCLRGNRNRLASCFNTGCFECALSNDANCTNSVVGFIERHKSKELLEEACENMIRFAVVEDKCSRGHKTAALYNCADLPGVEMFCHKEDCIFYKEDLDDCRPVRTAWLKDKVKVYE